MHIRSIKATGFANFTQPVLLGPLEEINVIYGPNNGGKSNLLRALEFYFRLLGTGEAVTSSQPQTLDRLPDELQELVPACFRRGESLPITLHVEWSLSEEDLTSAGLTPDTPLRRVGTILEVKQLSRGIDLRVQKWMMDDTDIAPLDRGRDGSTVEFAQQVRRLLSDARPFQYDQPVLPYARLGQSAEGFPQALRDALFDARQSVAAEQRKRWTLFASMAGTLEAELGDGQWETVFDRATGRADVVYFRGEKIAPLASMGAGVQRLVGLLAELALAQERCICYEEPEWKLSPELQERFIMLARQAIETNLGLRQLFITTHSPTLAALGAPFALERSEDGPVVLPKPWEAAPNIGGASLRSGSPPAAKKDEGLGDLIGLVKTLAELEPEELAESGSGRAYAVGSR